VEWIAAAVSILVALYQFLVARGVIPADPYGPSRTKFSRYHQSFVALVVGLFALAVGFGRW
jgi:hypothetical protein